MYAFSSSTLKCESVCAVGHSELHYLLYSLAAMKTVQILGVYMMNPVAFSR